MKPEPPGNVSNWSIEVLDGLTSKENASHVWIRCVKLSGE